MLISFLLILEFLVSRLLDFSSSPFDHIASGCSLPRLRGLFLFLFIIQTIGDFSELLGDFVSDDILSLLAHNHIVRKLDGELLRSLLLALISK